MEFNLPDCSPKPYVVSEPEKIATPRLLFFRGRLEHNLSSMREALGAFEPAFSAEDLCPHVKTHKSGWVTRKLIDFGVSMFKSTPNEAGMLASAGAREIFFAYPPLPDWIEPAARLAAGSPGIRFYWQAGHTAHIGSLAQAAQITGSPVPVFLDLDVGMGRTGIGAEKAVPIARLLVQHPGLEMAGVHAYNGHNYSRDKKTRSQEAERGFQRLRAVLEALEADGIEVPRIVMGGTPSFIEEGRQAAPLRARYRVCLSPGTWVLSDLITTGIHGARFEPAALILARVMDRPGAGRATLNLGHKRYSVDQGPLRQLSVPEMRPLSWSEEHTVVSAPGEAGLDIGAYVLIPPVHVCSTVNLWSEFTVIGPGGEIELPACPIEGRNR